MKKYYLNPATLPDWSNYFSQIAVVEKNGIKTIYVAGQVGVDRQKNLVGNGKLREQLQQTFSNLQTALASVDATMANVVKMNIYVVNYQPSDAETIGEVIGQYFRMGQLPAMSLIGVQALAEERFLVEVDAEAVVDRDE
ncbi:MAG: RidA family protein [Xenococcaceae cyanobacterium MO_234.B1]|nr:RidA family protein [Xenococcaceae cyanobacterium MO_234.B1]